MTDTARGRANMSDSDSETTSITDENDTLEDRSSQPVSGEGDDGDHDRTPRDAGMGLDPRAEPDENTKREVEEEREKRLDPDNRPENAEIDNTSRDFDVARGMFTDNDDHHEDEPAPFSDPEDPNNPDSEAGDGPADDPDDPDDPDDKAAG
jgi:hypothetical protein